MYPTYKEIFDVRAHQYHLAMQHFPEAREEEFLNSISIFEKFQKLKKGDLVIDIPAGGCYLKKYLADEIAYIAFEESENFIKHTNLSKKIRVEYFCDNSLFQIKDNSINALFSIAGVHHNANLKKLFKEISRILKKDSLALIADVYKGSDQDYFLNEFVDANSSAGHKGVFLDSKIIEDLNSASLEIVQDEISKYFWRFADEEKMIFFCKNLFGIDKANDDEISEAIKSYLGIKIEGKNIAMNWSLRNILVKAR
jgi:SAM-dependent methyltransferase